ncbi:DUF3896 family protein [Cytobacillus sp. Hz8]|uniref:DUF3896 family protein n=1 Tax=Cytobacillus sp. Hz8 TaxID=3347168 RepID=UPI0035D90164
MDYFEVKSQLTAKIQDLNKKLENNQLTVEDHDSIKRSIYNYQYILELTDMNHFERGFKY